jgi:hypothetical protein
MNVKGLLPKFSRRTILWGVATSSVGLATAPAGSEEKRSGIATLRPLFKVLTLDGGGARGYLSIGKLANVES